MHRRPLGNGRRLATIGAIITVIGCLLPWYVWGDGTGGLPTITVRAFDSTGLLALLAAIATLSLVTLPYATEQPIGVDRGLAFGLLAVLGLVGVFLAPITVPGVLGAPEGLRPDRAYGYWIAVVGTIIMARAAFDISREPPRR
jgi:hypothetical protein